MDISSKKAEQLCTNNQNFTFPVEFRSLRGHFHSRWTAFEAKAKIATPEFV